MTRVPSRAACVRSVGRVLVLVALAAGLGAGAVVGVAHAHDERLDNALLTLQKAEGLLNAAQAGVTTPKVQHKFDRHIERALNLIGRAMDQIQEAADVVDNP